MSHSTHDLIVQMGRDVDSVFGKGPNALVVLDEHGWIGLTGVPACADLNMAALAKGASTDLVESYAGQIEERELDAILVIDDDASELKNAAEGRGLTQVGNVPVMVWENKPAPIASARYKVRMAERQDQSLANNLAARAFSLDEDKLAGACPASVQDAVDIWLVEDGNETLGCGWFVRTGNHVGVYTMSTPAEHQRKGVGRAVLDAAMAHYLDHGATTFTLEATEAGFHLYEQIGFETVATPAVYVVGVSTQFPG